MPTALIDDVLTELKAKYGISKIELERIVDSQFKVARLNIEEKSLKTVNLIHLGKIAPSPWFVKNRPIFLEKMRLELDKDEVNE
jgi:hypothetical protein